MRRSKLIALALIGLLAGAVGPLSSSSFAGEPSPPRQWIEAVNQVDGTTHLISGWIGSDGKPHFDPREYPQFVAKTPAPALIPDTAPSPATPGPKSDWPYPQLGVVQSKIPKPVAGQAWYGGNAAKVIEADGNPGKTRPPDVHLTVIGDDVEQDRARAKLEADPQFKALAASMGDRLAVQFYRPTDPMVARVGLVDGGKPDIVVQDSTGKERKRFHADPGPLPIVAEIRKADPNYKPGRDDAPGASLTGPAYLLVGVVAAGAWLLFQRSKPVAS